MSASAVSSRSARWVCWPRSSTSWARRCARRPSGAAPASRAARSRAAVRWQAADRERLEIARETKYREIRDAELDYRTGKLSERDYRELDAELRAEALTILDSLEEEGATPRAASEE